MSCWRKGYGATKRFDEVIFGLMISSPLEQERPRRSRLPSAYLACQVLPLLWQRQLCCEYALATLLIIPL